MVKSGQVVVVTEPATGATGALVTPSVGPAAVLKVNGVTNGATVVVTGSNPYVYTVTLPALTAGDLVEIYATATISSIATEQTIFRAAADTVRVSEVTALTATAVWAAGSRTLSSFGTLVADVAAAVWASAARTLTSFGTLAADVWAVAARTITGGTIDTNSDKTGYALSSAGVTAVQLGLALEATLAAMKGSGWTDENLKVIQGILAGIYGVAGSGWVVKSYRSKLPGGAYGPGVLVTMAYTTAPTVLYGPQISDADGYTYWIGRTGVDRGRFYNRYGGAGYPVDEEDF